MKILIFSQIFQMQKVWKCGVTSSQWHSVQSVCSWIACRSSLYSDNVGGYCRNRVGSVNIAGSLHMFTTVLTYGYLQWVTASSSTADTMVEMGPRK